MKYSEKKEIAAKIMELLNLLLDEDDRITEEKLSMTLNEPIQMLTIKECASLVPGLTVSTVRRLIADEKLPYMRAGAGEKGKILISKRELFKCLEHEN